MTRDAIRKAKVALRGTPFQSKDTTDIAIQLQAVEVLALSETGLREDRLTDRYREIAHIFVALERPEHDRTRRSEGVQIVWRADSRTACESPSFYPAPVYQLRVSCQTLSYDLGISRMQR